MPGPPIGHLDQHGVPVPAQGQDGRASLPVVLDRVRQQVQQDLLEALPIGQEVRVAGHGVAIHPQLDASRGRHASDEIDRLGHEMVELHGLDGERQRSRLDAADVEDLVDQGEQMPTGQDDLLHALELVGGEVLHLQHLREAEDGVERRAELVADPRQEVALRHARPLGLLSGPHRRLGRRAVAALGHLERSEALGEECHRGGDRASRPVACLRLERGGERCLVGGHDVEQAEVALDGPPDDLVCVHQGGFLGARQVVAKGGRVIGGDLRQTGRGHRRSPSTRATSTRASSVSLPNEASTAFATCWGRAPMAIASTNPGRMPSVARTRVSPGPTGKMLVRSIGKL
jgi:hypothetical protein